ncbi:MAG: 23S rRNA (guanosine(2251)-2'-O)-methyltransferase RlmB [Planctomycetes bacterium]|nr:23S rRNA (guanosine(2251)-2'-O)-methyltransferase RlmB [Planctomycetota bacterium]
MIHLEGRIAVEAALVAGRRRIEALLLAPRQDGGGAARPGEPAAERLEPLLALAAQRGVAVERVAATELDRLAHGKSHGGVLARCEPLRPLAERELAGLLERCSGPPLLLLLEGVDDDRNLGFTLRTAEALGATALLVKKQSLDFDETEVARSASGALERLPLVHVERDGPLWGELRRRRFARLACVANAKRTIWEHDLVGPTLLAIGGEKRGLSAAVRDECSDFASIPMQSEAGSLSLSHAAAIALAEAARQRRAHARFAAAQAAAAAHLVKMPPPTAPS